MPIIEEDSSNIDRKHSLRRISHKFRPKYARNHSQPLLLLLDSSLSLACVASSIQQQQMRLKISHGMRSPDIALGIILRLASALSAYLAFCFKNTSSVRNRKPSKKLIWGAQQVKEDLRVGSSSPTSVSSGRVSFHGQRIVCVHSTRSHSVSARLHCCCCCPHPLYFFASTAGTIILCGSGLGFKPVLAHFRTYSVTKCNVL